MCSMKELSIMGECLTNSVTPEVLRASLINPVLELQSVEKPTASSFAKQRPYTTKAGPVIVAGDFSQQSDLPTLCNIHIVSFILMLTLYFNVGKITCFFENLLDLASSTTLKLKRLLRSKIPIFLDFCNLLRA